MRGWIFNFNHNPNHNMLTSFMYDSLGYTYTMYSLHAMYTKLATKEDFVSMLLKQVCNASLCFLYFCLPISTLMMRKFWDGAVS